MQERADILYGMRRLSASRPLSLTGLAVVLGLLFAGTAAVGVGLTMRFAVDEAGRDIGRWLLQLSLVFAGTGVISAVLKQADVARARREAWAESLHELIRAHDEVQMAGRLLSAHATAKTYREQMEVVTAARGTLRRLSSNCGEDERVLHDALLRMRRYLKQLVLEYRDQYLQVARQQRLDEETLDVRLRALAKDSDSDFAILPSHLGQPLPAGAALMDRERFPRLVEFQTGFKESDFRRAYEEAKPLMQEKAGLTRPG
jgi:hypothetical protein